MLECRHSVMPKTLEQGSYKHLIFLVFLTSPEDVGGAGTMCWGWICDSSKERSTEEALALSTVCPL